MLLGVGAYLRDLSRIFSCGQFMGTRTISPTNGDALSVLRCVCAQSWTQQVQNPGLQTQAYIDDRTLASSSAQTLAESWARSQSWNRESHWQVNLKKTHLMCSGAGALEEWRRYGDPELEVHQHCQILGHDVVTNPRTLPKKQRERELTVPSKLVGRCNDSD